MTNEKITPAQVLFPVLLLSFVVMVFLAFQTHAMLADHDALTATRAQQDKPIEEAGKVKAQVNALAVGTLNLAKSGNKDAENIVAGLKRAGIEIGGGQTQGATP